MAINDIKSFLKTYDNGTGWGQSVDGRISDKEVNKAGGYEKLAADYAGLTPAAQTEARAHFENNIVRQAFDRVADKSVAQVVDSFDLGAKGDGSSLWAKAVSNRFTQGANDGALWVGEVQREPTQFVEHMRGLSPDEQLRALERMDSRVVSSTPGVGDALRQMVPAAFDTNNFGVTRSTSPDEDKNFIEARRFMRELGLAPSGITGGLTAQHLASFPQIPATPGEAFIRDLRNQLGASGRMDMVGFVGFMKSHVLKQPVLTVAELSQALSTDPERFRGQSVVLHGFAEFVSTKYETDYVQAQVRDPAGGMKWERVAKDRTETIFRLRDQQNPSGPSMLVRDDDSSWMREGAIQAGQRYEVSGRVAKEDGGYRIELSHASKDQRTDR